jgi:hypothetical protein
MPAVHAVLFRQVSGRITGMAAGRFADMVQRWLRAAVAFNQASKAL